MSVLQAFSVLLLLGVTLVNAASFPKASLSRRHQTERTVASTIHFGGDLSSSVDTTRSELQSNQEPILDSNYERFPRNFDPFGSAISDSYQSTVYGQAYSDSEPLDWASSNDQDSVVSNFARGSPEDDSFTLHSAPKKNWNTGMRSASPKKGNSRISFGPSSSSIAVSSSYAVGGMRRRSKRYAPESQQRRNFPPQMYMNNYKHYNNNYHPGYQAHGGGYEEEKCYYHTLVNGDSEMLLRFILPVRLRGRTIVRTCIPPTPNVNDPRYKVLLRGSNQSSFGHMSVSAKI